MIETSANLIISPTNLIVDYGDQVELTCQTNLIHPFDIQWLHNGQTIMEKHLIQHAYDRSILHIEQANEKQTGIYQCFSNRTFNDEMIHSMAMTLVVRRKSIEEKMCKNKENNLCFFLFHLI